MDAIRGMRNPLNSWDKMDSVVFAFDGDVKIGNNDLALMKKLVKAGTDHRKFLRMITVYMDITAPLYWWKEYDTYKVGTVANSCSTMHKITAKEFRMDDFSHEHLCGTADTALCHVVNVLNLYRGLYLGEDNPEVKKEHWWQLIQLLPSSYNQKRTVMLNYEVLRNIYHARRNHKLDEWKGLCAVIELLPYFEVLIA
ncbi:MAG: hypothetical protein IJ729_00150 [Alloprevotella sp.]|nr:hypothetical protein [Alloprevotella sp.]